LHALVAAHFAGCCLSQLALALMLWLDGMMMMMSQLALMC
jgi:hypothetical protein